MLGIVSPIPFITVVYSLSYYFRCMLKTMLLQKNLFEITHQGFQMLWYGFPFISILSRGSYWDFLGYSFSPWYFPKKDKTRN